MKIEKLQISNVMTFSHANIDEATSLSFENGLTIIIGENGSGKSTALEVLNFLFRKVFFLSFNLNQDSYANKSTIRENERKQILTLSSNNSYSDFRLEKNWEHKNDNQIIQVSIKIDEIDQENIKYLQDNKEKLEPIASKYSSIFFSIINESIDLEGVVTSVELQQDNNFAVQRISTNTASVWEYLQNYHFYKLLIEIYNLENPDEQIRPLYESYTMISGYRNYHSYNSSVSLKDSSANQQIQKLDQAEYQKSTNSNETKEPSIFNLVRLKIADEHFELSGKALSEEEVEKKANDLPILKSVNKKLALVGMKCRITCTNRRTWDYSFQFYDLKSDQALPNINLLSAGQKAIIHLVFETYGRGSLKGGLVIIDEPEIHLHYQFQHEYLRMIEELNTEQHCQYVLVTHSESLINAQTIRNIRRFALTTGKTTTIKAPTLTKKQHLLVKILDNTRSTHAFFCNKVLLVEGESDRYFYTALLDELYSENRYNVAILDICGKNSRTDWTSFFEAFGLTVYFIGDLDAAYRIIYNVTSPPSIKGKTEIKKFQIDHPDYITKIQEKYSECVYILSNGELEDYLQIQHGLIEVIKFCGKDLSNFVKKRNKRIKEIKMIISQIMSRN